MVLRALRGTSGTTCFNTEPEAGAVVVRGASATGAETGSAATGLASEACDTGTLWVVAVCEDFCDGLPANLAARKTATITIAAIKGRVNRRLTGASFLIASERIGVLDGVAPRQAWMRSTVQRCAGSRCKQFSAISRKGSGTDAGTVGSDRLSSQTGGRWVSTSTRTTPSAHTSDAGESP